MEVKILNHTDKISFLHISDLHFRKAFDSDHKLIFEELLKDIVKFSANEKIKYDFIVISGDLAFSGKSEEYEVGHLYISKLMKVTRVLPTHLIIVPGNHDVDRDKIGTLPIGPIKTQKKLSDIFSAPSDISFLCQKFEAFQDFLNLIVGAEYHQFSLEHPFYSKVIQIGQVKIGIAALNSEVLSQNDDDIRKLAIGEFQMKAAIEELETDGAQDLKICVFHHPIFELAQFDRESVLPLLMHNFDLVLSGHIHGTDSWWLENPDGHIQMLGAGPEYADRMYHNSYSIVKVDIGQMKGEVFLRQWINEGGGRWASYAGRFEKQRIDGSFTFNLRGHDKIEHKDDRKSFENQISYQAMIKKLHPLLLSQKEILAKEQGYIPLKFNFVFASDSETSHNLESYLLNWLKTDDDNLVFLLGGYGTGKSTFLRHFTGLLAELFLKNPQKYRVPIMIPLGELLLHGTLERLSKFELLKSHGFSISFEELKVMMENGKAVVLLDGFDEIAPGDPIKSLKESLGELSTINFSKNKLIISGRTGSIQSYPETWGYIGKERKATLEGFRPNELLISLEKKVSPSIELYINMLDDQQVEKFIDNYPNANNKKRQQIRKIISTDVAIKNLIRRPVVLKLLLDSEPSDIAGVGLKSVSDFYKKITEAWGRRELERRGVPSSTEAPSNELESLLYILESLAWKLFTQPEKEIDEIELVHLINEKFRKRLIQLELGVFVDIISSCVFLEKNHLGLFLFKHQSFLEFQVANYFLRIIEHGNMPNLGKHLPSIEIIDFLRELFSIEAAKKSIHILDRLTPPSNIKIMLIIALRQYPKIIGNRLFKYASNLNEPFGVRRVAALSLAETAPNILADLISLLENDRRARFENYEFLSDLWKANSSEIVRRTRLRLQDLENVTRPYWYSGRCIHIATLGQVGGEDEISIIEGFIRDSDPFVSSCAQKAINSIELRASPKSKELDSRLDIAFKAVQRSGKLLRNRYRRDSVICLKDIDDITSNADIESENLLIQLIKENFPQDSILSEEGGEFTPKAKSGFRWIIDPLDGTVNFMAGFDRFAIAIAIEFDNETIASVIYAPIADDIYWARLGRGSYLGDYPLQVESPIKVYQPLVAYATSKHSDIAMSKFGANLFKEITLKFKTLRLFGCSSLDFCDLAAGRFDGLVKLKGQLWDLEPGALVVKEADGFVNSLNDDIDRHVSDIIAGSSQDIVNSMNNILEEAMDGLL